MTDQTREGKAMPTTAEMFSASLEAGTTFGDLLCAARAIGGRLHVYSQRDGMLLGDISFADCSRFAVIGRDGSCQTRIMGSSPLTYDSDSPSYDPDAIYMAEAFWMYFDGREIFGEVVYACEKAFGLMELSKDASRVALIYTFTDRSRLKIVALPAKPWTRIEVLDRLDEEL